MPATKHPLDVHERLRAKGNSGDGVREEFTAPGGAPDRVGKPQRWLVVCLDGVPFAIMNKLWQQGHFREFFPPGKLISTFPSDTEVALTALLGAPPVPGYEHRFFDRSRNCLRGGALWTVLGGPIPYLRQLDYTQAGIWKALHFLFPQRVFRADLGRFKQAFRQSGKPCFLAHLSSTDALFHVLELPEVERLLLEVEVAVRELYLEEGGRLGVLLFSDHGNTLQPCRLVPLREELQHRGWRLVHRLRRAEDVVAPAYGLVGFIALYCHPEQRGRLAEDVVSMDGVDLVVFLETETNATVLSPGGQRARVAWSGNGCYRYEPLSGDPLRLLPVLEPRTSSEAGVYRIADSELRTLLLAHKPYPDALARIQAWARSYVSNRCDVLVSLQPGYYYGKPIFEWFVDLVSSHGGLDEASSIGFAMASRPLPACMRLEELLEAAGIPFEL